MRCRAPPVARYNACPHPLFEFPVMSFVRKLFGASLLRVAALCAVLTLTLSGCAGLFGGDPLRVSVAGIEPLESQGLEVRFNVKLRVQNPNESAVSFNGVSLDLELNGHSFAS